MISMTIAQSTVIISIVNPSKRNLRSRGSQKNHFQLNLNMTFEDAWQLESPGSSETNEDERNSFSFARKLFDENNEIKEEEEEEEEMDDDFGPGKLTFSFL